MFNVNHYTHDQSYVPPINRPHAIDQWTDRTPAELPLVDAWKEAIPVDAPSAMPIALASTCLTMRCSSSEEVFSERCCTTTAVSTRMVSRSVRVVRASTTRCIRMVIVGGVTHRSPADGRQVV